MIKILVTGSNGQLGQEFQSLANQYPTFEFVFFDRQQWDITNESQSEDILSSYRPQFLINTAAFTAVDKAETEQASCSLLNDHAPTHLSQLCEQYNIQMIHYSSDYVFGGDSMVPIQENAQTNPQGVYAKSKAFGEKHILASNPKTIIIRSSWIYSSFGHNFVKTMLRLAKDKKELSVVSDQTGSPTYGKNLCIATLAIIEHFSKTNEPSEGRIYHYSNSGYTTWDELAREIFSYKKIDIKVNSISTQTYNAPAPRPKFSVLDCTKIKTTFDVTIPFWKDSLHDCLDLISI